MGFSCPAKFGRTRCTSWTQKLQCVMFWLQFDTTTVLVTGCRPAGDVWVWLQFSARSRPKTSLRRRSETCKSLGWEKRCSKMLALPRLESDQPRCFLIQVSSADNTKWELAFNASCVKLLHCLKNGNRPKSYASPVWLLDVWSLKTGVRATDHAEIPRPQFQETINDVLLCFILLECWISVASLWAIFFTKLRQEKSYCQKAWQLEKFSIKQKNI